jgi:Flp pilus assembly protein TadG
MSTPPPAKRVQACPLATLHRLIRDRRGNVTMMLGFALLPLTFAVGMGIDYSRAMRTQSKLNAAADAAALAAVTAPMMLQSDATACTLARKMFIAQAANLEGLTLDTTNASQLAITIVDNANQANATTTACTSATNAAYAASYSRTVTVAYRGTSTNVFGNILGVNTLTVKGSSQANAATAPNIDFYLALDISGSMLIAATEDGINTMVNNTSAQGGCAFACHQKVVTDNDTAGNPTDPSTHQRMDNYALARSLNVTLRSDLVTDAAQNLMDFASTTSQTNGATYRMAIGTFNTAWRTVQTKTADLAAAKIAAGPTNTSPAEMWSNSYSLNTAGNGGVYSNDTDTSYTNMWAGLNTIATLPGDGQRLPGHNPQGVIFIVTDGVRDEAVGGNVDNRYIAQLEKPAVDPAYCEYAKSLNFRIAILYTSYFPLPTNSFYNQNVAPFQTQISTNLQACASPGLFSEVSTGGDISAALQQLFASAVATAHLTQ